MSGLFGGVMVPLRRDIAGLESSETGLRRIERHAVVDHFSIDLDQGMVFLGPLARRFHGLPEGDGLIGIRRFLECYLPEERSGLLCLIERLASDEHPFHYTARLADPRGPFVHGFIERAEDGDDLYGEWSGVMILSRNGLESTACFDGSELA